MEAEEDLDHLDRGTIVRIYFADISVYFGEGTRPLRTGQEIVDAGWVYAIGIAPLPASNKIIGLVIQTSHLTGPPHEVHLEDIEDAHYKWKCSCSCKAGSGAKCKHIAACLIHIFRYMF